MPQVPAADALADFYFIEKDEPEAILATAQDAGDASAFRAASGCDPVRRRAGARPMNRGLLGTASLNAALQEP